MSQESGKRRQRERVGKEIQSNKREDSEGMQGTVRETGKERGVEKNKLYWQLSPVQFHGVSIYTSLRIVHNQQLSLHQLFNGSIFLSKKMGRSG